MAIIEKLKESKNIGVALNLLRQIGLGMEDQLLHGIDFDKSHDEIVSKALVSPVYYPVEEVNQLASF